MFFPLRAIPFVAIVSVATFGCSKRTVAPPPDTPPRFPDLGIVASNYPKVDGSTSAEPLQVLLACKVLGGYCFWSHSESDDSHRLVAATNAKAAATRGGNDPLSRFINSAAKHQGTHSAYVNLITGRVDMILVARRPSNDELRLAARKDVELDIEPVALDAFVFLLNDDNPVDDLTVDEIRDIFSGRTLNWAEFGGTNVAINAYQRNRNSGSQEVMQELVMKGREMSEASELFRFTLMGQPFWAVDSDPAGIGYSFYYYQEFMAPRAVKTCAVNGVNPAPETISSRQYPLVTELCAVLRRDTAAEHPARELRDWLLTSTGQRIVQECGFVSINESIAKQYVPRSSDRFKPVRPPTSRVE